MNRPIKLTLLLFLILGAVLPTTSLAQQEAEPVLLFSHQRKDKKKYVKADSKVLFRLKADGEKQKGILEQIKDSTIVISGNEYALSEFSMIAGKSKGLRQVKVIGGVFMATGAGSIGLGAFSIFMAYNQIYNLCVAILIYLLGILLVIGGGILFVIGLVPMLFRAKRFDLVNDWTVSIGETVPRGRKRKSGNRKSAEPAEN